MIIVNKKTLEKNLGFKIKNNIYVLALDTATTTGVAMVKVLDKKVQLNVCTLKIPSPPKDCEDNSAKYEEFMNMLLLIIRDFKKTLDNKKKNTLLVLENSFLGMNPSTYGFLKAMMGVLYSELYDNFEKIKMFYPTQTRKMVGFHSEIKRPKGMTSKEKTLARKARKQEIVTFVNNILKTDIDDDNIADACMLAFAGLKEEN